MAQKEEFTKQELEESNQGIIDEEFPQPTFVKGEEIVNSSKLHNAWIVIGRDRPQGKASGYGRFPKNKDGDKCSSIDIVVGRDSAKAGTKGHTRKDTVGNNIQLDASRIYISQKTNIDENFIIHEAGTLTPAVGKAAIGLKSDNIRIVSRESVKIVAATGEVNSLGDLDQSVKPIIGIQLITGPKTEAKDVQGIVKSENLRGCLEAILKQIDMLAGTLSDYILYQTDFNDAVAKHDHLGHFRSDFAGSTQVVKSFSLPEAMTKYTSQTMGKSAMNIQSIRLNLGVSKEIKDRETGIITNKYLSKSLNPSTYIGSPYNKTN